MTQPLVSVIMPTYNQAGFVGEAVDSVLRQTYKNFELIVIDNHSTDKTEEVVRLFTLKDARVKYIKFSNQGVIGKSRNVGIREARGEYLAFLDSDDSWLETKLERVMEWFNRQPETDLVCHDELHVDLASKRTKRVRYGLHKDYARLLFKGNAFSTSAVVVRRSKVLEAGLFSENEAFVTAEDYELWMRLSRISRIAFLHEPLGHFNIHGESSSKRIEKHMSSALNVVSDHFSRFKPQTFYHRILINRRKGAIYRAASNQSFRTADRKFALKTIMSSLRAHPISLKSWVSFSLILWMYFRPGFRENR